MKPRAESLFWLVVRIHICPYFVLTRPQIPMMHYFLLVLNSTWKQLLFGETTYCSSCPFSSFTVGAKWQPALREALQTTAEGIHMSPLVREKIRATAERIQTEMLLKPTAERPGSAHQPHFFCCHSKPTRAHSLRWSSFTVLSRITACRTETGRSQPECVI